ncbi:uncharacterized protein N7459_005712 [Penicillium hispanicum]|uniref:uncharacterized protein n=1 Tax=Penicillium hispanicum TaxID=1080232 RepID=UPI00253FD240|nr:uncharacterized protein N7459_005712 [Penicillium hispanicum]KAJ5579727.1 hypothetical protein N7459_005712 [Penicillium hispanicum]
MLSGVSHNLARGAFLKPPHETTNEPPKSPQKSNPRSKYESRLKPKKSISTSKSRLKPKKSISTSKSRSKRKARTDEPEDAPSQKPIRRRATLYDAVAGRVNIHGFHPPAPVTSKYRDTASSGARDLRPEEALFRSKTLLKRFTENESYFAHEKLPVDRPLPSSEILEAVHAYTADYYQHLARKSGRYDHYTMDETALLAVGILVEEMARDSLGQCGDLVLLEGQSSDEDEGATSDATTGSRGRKRRRRSTVVDHPISQHEHLRGVRQKFKRRRLKRSDSNANKRVTVDKTKEAEKNKTAQAET